MSKMKIGDKIMIVIVILAAISLLVYYRYWRDQGDERKVIVEKDGAVVRSIDLPQEELLEFIIQIDEQNFNRIQVRGEQAAVVEATCPDQICTRTGWIQNSWEAIVCLPHKLIVRIAGEDLRDDELDIR